METSKETLNVLWLLLAGTLAGVGQLLASKEVLTVRIVTGRALSSGMLGLSAGSVLTFVPGLPIEALIGLSCVSASLGTSGMERVVQKFISK